MRGREAFELVQSGLEQRLRARAVAALVMVEGRRHLDNPLQKRPLWFRRGQPDLFPRFVGLEELPAVELLHTSLELLIAFGVIGQRCVVWFECVLRNPA